MVSKKRGRLVDARRKETKQRLSNQEKYKARRQSQTSYVLPRRYTIRLRNNRRPPSLLSCPRPPPILNIQPLRNG